MKEIITIQISKFLNNELVEQIAQKQWHSQSPAFVNRSRQYIFDEITKVPRPSKKEEKIRQYLKDWAAKNNIAVKEDETGNTKGFAVISCSACGRL